MGGESEESCLDYEGGLLLVHCASDCMLYMGEGRRGGGLQEKQIMRGVKRGRGLPRRGGASKLSSDQSLRCFIGPTPSKSSRSNW